MQQLPRSRSRGDSRESPTDSIRRLSASDPMDSLKEPLLSRVESQSQPEWSPVGRSSSTGTHPISPNTAALHAESVKLPPMTASFSMGDLLEHLSATIRHNPDAVAIAVALFGWYVVGVLAICTTKLLLSTPLEEGGVPSPLVLTFQQMCLGSCFLRTFLLIKGKFSSTGGIQPWPVEEQSDEPKESWTKWTSKVDYLLLAGLFNGLDFLASAICFSHSSASFVETIKASEPITTTALAIWWGIDRLGKRETVSLVVLVTGVLISTCANATTDDTDDESPATSLQESIKTVLTVMTANLCFAFRAMAQKMLRSSRSGNVQSLDDFNLLFRMQQTGAASLLVPTVLFQHYTLLGVVFGRELPIFAYWLGLSLLNAWAFASYTAASCFILTRISVVQHSGFGCLRRLFAIVVTSIFFGVPMSGLGFLGIFMSLVGFAAFSHFRFQRQGQGKKAVHESKSENGTESCSSSEGEV